MENDINQKRKEQIEEITKLYNEANDLYFEIENEEKTLIEKSVKVNNEMDDLLKRKLALEMDLTSLKQRLQAIEFDIRQGLLS